MYVFEIAHKRLNSLRNRREDSEAHSEALALLDRLGSKRTKTVAINLCRLTTPEMQRIISLVAATYGVAGREHSKVASMCLGVLCLPDVVKLAAALQPG